MKIIKECPFCKSKNLSLHIRGNEKDLMKAKLVELRCDSCGKWIKWVSKNEREIYMGVNIPKPRTINNISSQSNNTTTKKENVFVNKKKFNFDKEMANSELRFERDAYLMKSERLKQELEEAREKIRELEEVISQLQTKKRTNKKSTRNIKGDTK